MLWQVARWGLSINKPVLLLKYTETYVLCISLLYRAEWVICSWLKRSFANDSLTKNTDGGGGGRFWMWPGSDLYCAALTTRKIQQVAMMGVKTSSEAHQRPWFLQHMRRKLLKYRHLFTCGRLLQHCWLWQRRSCWINTQQKWSVPIFLLLWGKSQDLFFPLTAASELFKQHCLIWLKAHSTDFTHKNQFTWKQEEFLIVWENNLWWCHQGYLSVGLEIFNILRYKLRHRVYQLWAFTRQGGPIMGSGCVIGNVCVIGAWPTADHTRD